MGGNVGEKLLIVEKVTSTILSVCKGWWRVCGVGVNDGDTSERDKRQEQRSTGEKGWKR